MAQKTISELSVDELKKLIRKVIIQTFSGILGDPDKDLELRDRFRIELQQALAASETNKTSPAQDVAARLGLKWGRIEGNTNFW